MSRRTIMIVDDTPDHRAVLRHLLQAVGYHVVEASSGSDAVDKAQREQPDLILAALSLPGQRAWETAKQLGSLPWLARTPILGTTVYNTLLTPSRVYSIGCVGYIEKPFDLDALLFQIGTLLPTSPHTSAVI